MENKIIEILNNNFKGQDIDKARKELCFLFDVRRSALKSDLLADIKMSCDGTYSDAIDDWDLVDPAEDVINRINKTVDKHYC